MPDYGDFPGSVLGKPVFDKDRRIRDLEDENNWLRHDIAQPLHKSLGIARSLLVSLIDQADDGEEVAAVVAEIDGILDMCRTE